MSVFTLRSFAGGEIAPSLHARVDTAKYQTGVKKCENFIVHKHGGVVRRAGTQYIDHCYKQRFLDGSSTTPPVVRIIPYILTDDISYIVELGHNYLRVIDSGTEVQGTFDASPGYGDKMWTLNISNITSSGVVTASHGGSYPAIERDSYVRIEGVDGIDNINDMQFRVLGHDGVSPGVIGITIGDAHFEAFTAQGTYSSGGTISRIRVFKTPWPDSALADIRYTQSGNDLFLTASGYPIMRLRGQQFTSRAKWTFDRFRANTGNVAPLAPLATYEWSQNGGTRGVYANVNGGVTPLTWKVGQGRLTDGNPFVPPYTYQPRSNVVDSATVYKEQLYVATMGHHAAQLKDTREEYIRYAVSVVDVNGSESIARESLYVVRRGGLLKIQDAVQGSAGGKLIRSDNFTTITFSPAMGLGYKIVIKPGTASGAYIDENDSFTIQGKTWDGKFVSETVNAALYGSYDSEEIQLETVNYFASFSKIVTKNLVTADRIAIYAGEEDWEFIRLRWRYVPQISASVANRYRVYKSTGGRYGLIGETPLNYFTDYGAEPDYTEQPLSGYDPFSGTLPGEIKQFDSILYNPSASKVIDVNRYPLCSGLYQQSLLFARSNLDPERIWKSATGEYYNFNLREQLKDSSAFSFAIAGGRRGSIQHLLGMSKLLIFTDTGEWIINGSESGALTPTSVNAEQISQNGSGALRPLAIANDAIYYQPRGAVVRDLGWQHSGSGYQGNDLTVFAGHLFRGRRIVDWGYQAGPESVLWCIRDDGTALGLTYLKEHQIIAWHRHTTDGFFESVAVIPEGTGSNRRDVPYFVVKRWVNGRYVRHIERMMVTFADNSHDLVLCDNAVIADGWNTGTGRMTIEEYASGGFDADATVQVFSTDSSDDPLAYFTADNVGDEIHFGTKGDVEVIVTIASLVDSYSVLGVTSADVPASLQSAATSDWGLASTTVSGLWNLVGRDVAVFADGAVQASPNNTEYETITVGNDGTITLNTPAVRTCVGLPYTSNLQTLNIDTINGETLADKQKIVQRVTVHMEDSRGGFFGPNEPPNGGIDGLYEMQYDSPEGYVNSNDLFTGLNSIVMEADWADGGSIYIRQVDPLPMSILAVHPQFDRSRRREQ
jgi:hypothetical protein